ncbi:hypothetical protein [Actinacidiphila acidipaludis]|uniref:Uncharacterized protein n=1 Tax=Actinacidiphila acidipaludis TaxID=2873382 RepID=A0ABS7Q3U3_9ACTN|nr:hypothetical protein [Streptomyces acidipaludis]MBY8877516.1 hypothetical protein [Streptomyces acidipaludis]
MAYELEAVIGEGKALSTVAKDLPGARLTSIGQGLALMPMTKALADSVADSSGEGVLGFWRLPGGFEETLAAWSAGGPMAYVEAEYFGGVGEQRAAVWDGGTLVLGPLHLEEGQAPPPVGTPISQALRRLGVRVSGREDEFSAAGLDRHRQSEAWID